MRLEQYENASATPMVVLAVLYLGIYATEVLAEGLPLPGRVALEVTGNLIWAVFVADLAIRVFLAPRRLRYLLRHPIDVVVPMFRFLRVLRVITAGQWLVTRGRRLAVGRTAAAIVVAVSFLALVGGLAVLDAERGAPEARITTFGDAVWWAFTTMSTVGYGDMYPVTAAGRVVAVGMMTVGVSLLGVISATLATGFLAQTTLEQESESALMLLKLDRLQTQVSELKTLLGPEHAEVADPHEAGRLNEGAEPR